MIKPIAIQMISRYQFADGSENMSIRQVNIPRIGTTGYSGARNGLAASGLVRRMISTAAQTIKKAKRVPMLVRSSSASIGRKPVKMATNAPIKIVDFHGVRNLGWTSAKKLG